MADGGEGTLDAVLSRGGERACAVTGAERRARARPLWTSSSDRRAATAVIEVAQIVGITDPAGTARRVEQRTTRGVGELIRALPRRRACGAS